MGVLYTLFCFFGTIARIYAFVGIKKKGTAIWQYFESDGKLNYFRFPIHITSKIVWKLKKIV